MISRSSGEKFFMAPLGGEDCITISFLGFLTRLCFPSFNDILRFLDFTSVVVGGGEGCPGGGGGGIGANGVCGRCTGGVSMDCGGRWSKGGCCGWWSHWREERSAGWSWWKMVEKS